MLRAVDAGKFDELRRSICNVPDQLSDNSHAAKRLPSFAFVRSSPPKSSISRLIRRQSHASFRSIVAKSKKKKKKLREIERCNSPRRIPGHQSARTAALLLLLINVNVWRCVVQENTSTGSQPNGEERGKSAVRIVSPQFQERRPRDWSAFCAGIDPTFSGDAPPV